MSRLLLTFLCAFAFLRCGDDATGGRAIPIDGHTSPTLPDGSVTEADTAAETRVDTGLETSTDTATETTDTTADTSTAPETTADGPFVSIVIEGVLDDHAPADGLAAQTPSPYRYGLQRLELLRSADDLAPVTIFDYAPSFVAVDMHAKTVVARVPIASLPDGTFTHFRIALTHLDLEVAVALHYVPYLGDVATRVRIVYALAPVVLDGDHLILGDTRLSGIIAGVPFAIARHIEPVAPIPGPGAVTTFDGGTTHVTFMLAAPLETSPATPTDVTHICRFYIANSFRWQDATDLGHTADVWDVDLAHDGHAATIEPVKQVGANGFATALIVGTAAQ